MTIETRCKAADPNNCRFHSRLSVVNREMRALLATPATTSSYQKYHELAKEKELLAAKSALQEGDFSLLRKLPTPTRAEIRASLTRIAKGDPKAVEWDDFFSAAIHYTPAQAYGVMIEGVYARKSGYSIVKASQARGDVYDPKTGKYIEVKVTGLVNEKSTANFRQVRLHHELDSYHFILFSERDSRTEFYDIPKEEMTDLLEHTGWHLSHGTRAQKNPGDREYSISFKLGSDTHEHMQAYRFEPAWYAVLR